MNAEEAAFLLANALPPSARHPRFRRGFNEAQRNELARLGCTPQQAERLQRILPAIAYYSEAGPALADVRATLAQLGKDAHKATSTLRSLLDAPEHELARDEARLRLLEALAAMHPDRCEVNPQRVSTFHRYDSRLDEARRLLAALADVAAAADHARERMRGAPQTRAVAHRYPAALIDAALSVDGPQVAPSASAGSPFREIAAVCYAAAGATNADPVRAIRDYLRACNSSPEK